MASDLAYQTYDGERHHLESEVTMVESLYMWETKPEEWVVIQTTAAADALSGWLAVNKA